MLSDGSYNESGGRTPNGWKSNRRVSIREDELVRILCQPVDQPLSITKCGSLSFEFGRLPMQSDMHKSDSSGRATSPNANDVDENVPPLLLSNRNADGCAEVRGRATMEKMISSPEMSKFTAQLAAVRLQNGCQLPRSSCAIIENPAIARFQRDLNSPSANSRFRAIRALRSPSKHNQYYHFDVPHEEQDIITSEERSAPISIRPQTIQEVMKDVCVYVEFRAGEDNRTAGIKKVISMLGARVNDKLLRNTTHVVFKDGLVSTYRKAIQWNIPIVSILWIEECKKQTRLVDPKAFLIPESMRERYENPELYKKIRRQKSMQPSAEECVKSKKTKLTLPATSATMSISSSNVSKPPSQKTEDNLEKMLTEFHNNLCNDLMDADDEFVVGKSRLIDMIRNSPFKAVKLPETAASGRKKPAMIPRPLFAASTPVAKNLPAETINTPTVIRRVTRRSSLSECVTPIKSSTANDSSLCVESTLRRSSRRSSVSEMQLTPTPAPTPTASKALTPIAKPQSARRKTVYKPKFLNDPIIEEENAMDVVTSDKTRSTQKKRRTMHQSIPMEESLAKIVATESPHKQLKRMTIMTPQSIELTLEPIAKRRCTLTQNSQNVSDSYCTPPTSRKTLFDEHTEPPLTFSSTRLPPSSSRRKTMFNLSMEVIQKRVELINKETATGISPLVPPVSETKQTSIETFFKHKMPTSASAPVVAKKRKLFTAPSLSADISDTSIGTNLFAASIEKRVAKFDRPKAIAKRILDTVKKPMNRRRTTMDFQLPRQTTVPQTMMAVNRSAEPKSTIAYTNMESSEVDCIKEAITKLGYYRLEHQVSSASTHLIVGRTRRTANMLHAVVRGLWLVRFDWIVASLAAGRWLFEEPYEVRDFGRAAQISRNERSAIGSDYTMELFTDVGPFYVSERRPSPVPAAIVRELIRLCGGRVERKQRHARIIVGDVCGDGAVRTGSSTSGNTTFVNQLWILDSITDYKLKKIHKYTLSQNN